MTAAPAEVRARTSWVVSRRAPLPPRRQPRRRRPRRRGCSDLPSPSAAAPAPAARPAAPGFLAPATARGESLPSARSVVGESSLVTLQTSLLPRRADGQPISFDLGRQSVTGRFTHIERNPAYTAWTGSLDVDLGSFTIVRSGSVYRASITSTQGMWEVTRAEGSRYWLTAVAPYAGPSGADTITARPTAAAACPAGRPVGDRRRARQDPHRRALRLHPGDQDRRGRQGRASRRRSAGGGRHQRAFASSGIKAQIRVKGIVKVKGSESNNVIKDLRQLQRAHDGKFDSALRARAKHHADIVHLFTGGSGRPDLRCRRPALHPALRGAHPGRLHVVPLVPALHRPDARARSQPAAPTTSPTRASPTTRRCGAPTAGTTCRATSSRRWATTTRARTSATTPACGSRCFSNPKGNFFGFPIGTRQANNAKVIKRLAPIVARYSR